MGKIGIIVNPAKDPGLHYLKRVIAQLESAGFSYAVSCGHYETDDAYPFCPPEECFNQADLVLTLGCGDVNKCAHMIVERLREKFGE